MSDEIKIRSLRGHAWRDVGWCEACGVVVMKGKTHVEWHATQLPHVAVTNVFTKEDVGAILREHPRRQFETGPPDARGNVEVTEYWSDKVKGTE